MCARMKCKEHTHRRWLFQTLKTIRAMATTIPQPETVLMHTNNDNDTVRRTRRTIVRSCGICNHKTHCNFNSIYPTCMRCPHQQRKIAFAIPWLCKAYLHHATPPFIASLILSRRIIWKMMQNWKICEHWFQIILVKFSDENCHWLYGIMTENKCSKMEICWWWWQRYVPNTHTPKFEFKFKIPDFKFRACRRVFFDGLKCPLWLR